MDAATGSFARVEPCDAEADARRFGELFPDVYLRFHRRDGKRRELPGASRGVLLHLTHSGPLSVGELAKHLNRAQSVVSEIVEHLERDGLLERMRDPADKRRSLVWLSDAGQNELERDREVLSRELLTDAMARMTAAERRALLRGMSALVRAHENRPNQRRKS
jgi:DNA-binding MarR family transcriptional regulator